MSLPDFLKPEAAVKQDPKFIEALRRYKSRFGEGVSTAELTMSKDAIIEMINVCIETDTTWREYLGIAEEDADIDY